MSYTFEITTAGKALVAKAQTGTAIEFTKAELGKGDLTGSPAEFTSLLDHVPTNVKIQQKEYVEGAEDAKITLTYDNETLLSEGFYVKEIGLYANDPDEGEILFLYCHSDDADYLPVSNYASVEQVVNLIIKVDNASNVTAQIQLETNVIRDNFSANSILKADNDSEPEALIVEENRIIGRKEGGVIDDLTPVEVRKVIGVTGALWDENENYSLFARVIGTDGNIYNARKPSGPDNNGSVNPVGDTTLTWTTTEPHMAGEFKVFLYEPTAAQMLQVRFLPAYGQTLDDEDYPEVLEKWGGKIFGSPGEGQFYAPVWNGDTMRFYDPTGLIDVDERIDRGDGATAGIGTHQLDAGQRITGNIKNVAHGAYIASSGDGVFIRSYGTSTGNAAGGGGTENFNFNSANSVSPNPAKTSDTETRMRNTLFLGGFYY